MHRPVSNHYGNSAMQTVEFQSLRKTSQIGIAESDMEFGLRKQNNGVLIAMGCASMMYLPVKETLNTFQELSFSNIPKEFQPYHHERTLNEVLRLVRTKLHDIPTLINFINNYPIGLFLIEAFVRQKAKRFLQQNKSTKDANNNQQLLGNQLSILSDFQSQIRGPLLNIIAMALKLNVKIYYQIQKPEKQPEVLAVQDYGQSFDETLLHIWISRESLKVKIEKSLALQTSSSVNIQQPRLQKRESKNQSYHDIVTPQGLHKSYQQPRTPLQDARIAMIHIETVSVKEKGRPSTHEKLKLQKGKAQQISLWDSLVQAKAPSTIVKKIHASDVTLSHAPAKNAESQEIFYYLLNKQSYNFGGQKINWLLTST